MRIGTPSDAVEFDVRLTDLIRRADGEEVEPLNLVLARSDVVELPVPKNPGATSHQDLVGGDVRVGWCVQDTVDELCLAGSSYSTELGQTG